MSGDATISNTGVLDLADDAVELAEIAQNGATDGQVLKWDGATTSWVTADDDDSGAAALTDGNIFVGGAGDVPQDVTMSGDATISNTGVITVAPGAIDSGKIALNTITADDIATGAVQSDEIANGSIEGQDLSAMGALPAGGELLRYNGANWAAQEIGLNATAGSIFFSDAGLLGQSNGQLFWDNGSSELGIGTNTPDANLHVTGTSRFDGDMTLNGLINGVPPPDYVFQEYFDGYSPLKPRYKILSLQEVEDFAKINKHLPGIPSATEIIRNGLVVNKALFNHLEKIEELFLHTIEQEKKIKSLKAENEKLAQEVDSMKKDMELIKQMLQQKSSN